MIIGTVVEGPTDRLLLEAIIRKLIPGEHRFLALQPPATLGETGAGWKGVRRWCRNTWQNDGPGIESFLRTIYPPMDLLVIHLDADVAGERDLQVDDPDPVDDVLQPCPPASRTTARLALAAGRWLQRDTIPQQVVLAIPAQDTENWTFAGLYPADAICGRADYECTKRGAARPCYKLTLKAYGGWLQRSDGEIKKRVPRYQSLVPQVVAAWGQVCRICPQAQRFTQDLTTGQTATEENNRP